MVADGYKQTDIGVIPEDWELKNFKEVFTFLTTATYSRADLTEDGSIQYLHYGDIHTKYDFTLDFDKYELPHISAEQLRKYPLLKDGDIVMADASEDYNGICKSIEIQNLTSKKAIAGLHTFLLRDKNNMLINGFKGYIASSNLLKIQFDRLATGMKVFGVSKGNLLTVQIPVPPKQEQQAIATALSDTDELINSLEKLIAKKEAIKTGTMQELLTGKKRLDGFSGEWEEKTLETLGKFSKGSGVKKDEANSGDIPCIRYGEIYTLHNEYIKRFDSYISKEVMLTAKKLKRGDILFAGSGETKEEIGKCVAFIGDFISYAGGDIVIFSPRNIDSLFMGYYLNTPKIAMQKASKGQGDAVVHISASSLADIQVIIPKDIQEQRSISGILFNMDKSIDALRTKLSKVKAIKEGMMQELLTGRTRLLKDMT